MTYDQLMRLSEIDIDGFFHEDDRMLLPGLHFCGDFDGMAVAECCPEWELCACNKKPKHQANGKYLIFRR